MTTRLSPKRVKATDASYKDLKEELHARSLGNGTGGGYTPPLGGIPKSDLSSVLQQTITNVEKSHLIPIDGVSFDDLSETLETYILKINDMYVKPASGIPLADLEDSIQTKLTQFENYYIYPSSGIPKVDLDANVNSLLELARTSYQKPVDGIKGDDLSSDVMNQIVVGVSRYEKPLTGIPDEDLEERYAKEITLEPIQEHVNNKDIHITDHDKLLNVGVYSHDLIDKTLDTQGLNIDALLYEMEKARDDFSTVGNRLNSLLGLNSIYSVQKEKEWKEGTFEDLRLNKEGFVGLTYDAERPVMELYDIAKKDTFSDDTLIGHLYFSSDSKVNLGSQPWLPIINRTNNVGVKLSVNLYADVSGIYEFSTRFSGRMILKVNSTLLFDTQSVVGQVSSYIRTGQIYLESGRLYKLEFEGRYLSSGDRVFDLTWNRPGSQGHTEIAPEYFNTSGYMKRTGQYVSRLIDMKDNHISRWLFELDASDNRWEDDILVEIQRSKDNIVHTAWEPILDNGDILLEPTRYCRVRITVNQHHQLYSPVLRGFKIRYISSANNEMMKEIQLARDSFMTIDERLKAIEKQILDLAEFDALNDQNSFHPEYFASARLFKQEINTLRLLLFEVDRKQEFITMSNTAADHFYASNLIDDELSDKYEIVDNSIRTTANLTRLEKNDEWAKWELNNLDYSEDQLRLAYSPNGLSINTTTFNNWYTWSTRGTGMLGASYQQCIAQPFYTKSNTNLITRIMVHTPSYSNPPRIKAMICPTKGNLDIPEIQNPLGIIDLGYAAGTYEISNLRINVNGGTKYWLVLLRDDNYSRSGYSNWFLSYDNTSTNIRLRSSNPENTRLPFKYTTDVNSDSSWNVDYYYYLTFLIDEAEAYEPYGNGTRIIDYERETGFAKSVVSLVQPSQSLTTIMYQTSMDGKIWSKEYANIEDVKAGRFLKINLAMDRSSSNSSSPLLNRIDIHSAHENSYLYTKMLELESVPTHAALYAENDEGVLFHISRDDGRTWKPLLKTEYTQLDDIQPGMKIRVRMTFDYRHPSAWLHRLAFSTTTYRDITQQNTVALYEEYIAESDQQVFKLRDRYIMGNHSLQVYLNGIRQSIFKDYIEVDNYTIMFNEPLLGGVDADRITFVVASGAYDQHDAHMKAEIDYVKEQVGHLNMSHSKSHVYSDTGQLLETTYNHEHYILNVSYEYDSHGRKKKETKMTKTYTEVIEYIYDENGMLIEETITVDEVMN